MRAVRRSAAIFVLLVLAVLSSSTGAKGRVNLARTDTAAAPTIVEKTAGTEKRAGYFNLYWDAKQGKLWLEVDKWNIEFLYQTGLPAGVGSNDIGLDRGQMGGTHRVRF